MTHDRGVDLGRGGLSFCILQDPSAPLCFTLSAGVLFPQVSEWFIHSRPSSPASNMSFPDLHSQPPTQSHTHTPHTCMHTHVHIHVHTEKHTCTCICAYTHRNTRMHTCIHRETQAHMCAYINTYTYTHIQFSSVQ